MLDCIDLILGDIVVMEQEEVIAEYSKNDMKTFILYV